MSDDARRLRIDDGDFDDQASRRRVPTDLGASCFVGKTTTVTTYPTTAGVYYAVIPQLVTGTPTEGGAVTYADAAGIVYALNLGASVPPAGTRVIVTAVKYRYTFRYG